VTAFQEQRRDILERRVVERRMVGGEGILNFG
jgi:hypothetical protein